MARLLRQAVLDRNWLDGMQLTTDADVAVEDTVAKVVTVAVDVEASKLLKVKMTLLPNRRAPSSATFLSAVSSDADWTNKYRIKAGSVDMNSNTKVKGAEEKLDAYDFGAALRDLLGGHGCGESKLIRIVHRLVIRSGIRPIVALLVRGTDEEGQEND